KKKYLEQPDKYFDNTDICIYVVDVRDIGRFSETLDYAKDVLEQFYKLQIQPKVYVFLHKAEEIFDGDLDSAKRVELFKQRLSDINQERFDIQFAMTTIYDLWTIRSTFSAIFQELYPRDQLIEKTMKELALRLNASAVALFDPRIIEMAGYAADPKNKDLVRFCAPYLYTFKSSVGKLQGIVASKVKVDMEGLELLFLETGTAESKLYFIALGGGNVLPSIDVASKEISTLLPELFAFLRRN
nr:hypothetical protein [Candidatus Sigynarchaeota archaeon]